MTQRPRSIPGSMTSFDAARHQSMWASAAWSRSQVFRLLHMWHAPRVLLDAAWSSPEAGRESIAAMEVSDSVMIVREAPHPAIFPRMKAAIHHGGAGTTTAAARAGVPQLILPHILDQYYWAHRVQLLGIGPRALPIETTTTERLTSRCRELIESTDYPENARKLAARMGTRDGVADAASILEQLIREC